MADKKKLIAKIRALLSKTVENGCTEEEMASALALAKRLMNENDLDTSDLEMKGEGVTVETRVVTDFDKIRYHLCKPVGDFCHCATWREGRGSDTINYCGLESETVFAHWLLDMLGDFVLFSLESYRIRMKLRRLTRLERQAFIIGCSNRIAQRLCDLTPRPQPGRGRDLIVLRSQLIDTHMRSLDLRLREPFKLYSLDAKLYAAGEEAGDRAQFNRPVEGMHERRLLS